MKYDWLEAYCESKQGAVREYKAEWEALRFLICGKMFVLWGTDSQARPVITLKCEPTHGQMLRDAYPDIIPGYYMNKQHWNSVLLQGDVPADVLRQMVDESYALVLGGLSKKLQKEIAEG